MCDLIAYVWRDMLSGTRIATEFPVVPIRWNGSNQLAIQPLTDERRL